jgi:hypothetical protein
MNMPESTLRERLPRRPCGLTRYGRLRDAKEVSMTNPLESIQPSLRYVREQRELEKVFVVDTPEGADGLGRVDLKSGHIKIPVKHTLTKPAPTEE